jgi:hypothetical protein
MGRVVELRIDAGLHRGRDVLVEPEHVLDALQDAGLDQDDAQEA